MAQQDCPQGNLFASLFCGLKLCKTLVSYLARYDIMMLYSMSRDKIWRGFPYWVDGNGIEYQLGLNVLLKISAVPGTLTGEPLIFLFGI